MDTNNKSTGKKTLIQFIKFGLVGVLNTIVNYVVYALTIAILGTDYYILANVLGVIISIFHAYLWQNKLIFKEEEGGEKRVWWQVLIKTYIAYSFTGLILNNLLLIFWLDIVKIEGFMAPLVEAAAKLGLTLTEKEAAAYVAPFFNMFVSIPLNFVINKFWAYRQKERKAE